MRSFIALTCVIGLNAAHSAPQVVADDACPKHAVDIAAYATCDGDEVAQSIHSAPRATFPRAESVPLVKRTRLGIYADALGAYRMKSSDPENIILVDVRSAVEVASSGRPSVIDFHVPYTDFRPEVEIDKPELSMTVSASFAASLAHRLESAAIDYDAIIVLICRSGENSARAADEMAELGYTHVVSVIDGFEGDVDNDGRRTVNGWKNANLPWLAPAAFAARMDEQRSN